MIRTRTYAILYVIIIAGTILSTSFPVQTATKKLALVRFSYPKINEVEANFLHRTLFREIEKIRYYHLIDIAKVDEAIMQSTAFALSTGCASDLCAYEIGREVGADLAVVGRYLFDDDRIEVTAYLYDVRNAKLLRKESVTSPTATEAIPHYFAHLASKICDGKRPREDDPFMTYKQDKDFTPLPQRTAEATPDLHPNYPAQTGNLPEIITEQSMEFSLIPAGRFEMGYTQKSDITSDCPKHTVYQAAFYIGRHEVTNSQYSEFLKATGHRQPENCCDDNKALWEELVSGSQWSRHPVVNVSWDDAVAYCNWLTTESTVRYRLPTEAEWEKAARGTDFNLYPWGNKADLNLCNCSYLNLGWTIGNPPPTKPVGSFTQSSSPYSLQDMAGNVWEWCLDWYDEDYYFNSPLKNPVNLNTPFATRKVCRGGSWNDSEETLTTYFRGNNKKDMRTYDIGFRVVREIP